MPQKIITDIFAWANTTSPSFTPAVHATVTIHSDISFVKEDKSDQVWYANGPLTLAQEGSEKVLKGVLPVRLNVAVVPPGGWFPTDYFPPSTVTLAFSVSSQGRVSLQKLVDGLKFLGQPPDVFIPTYTQGLLTHMLPNPLSSCTISFTLSKQVIIG